MPSGDLEVGDGAALEGEHLVDDLASAAAPPLVDLEAIARVAPIQELRVEESILV